MYILEGNIGAGKSTFLKLIAQHMPQCAVSYEPLDQWQHQVHGQSLLANFYQDPHRWAYSMETFTMLSRVQEHMREQQHSDQRRIIERSIYSGHFCFARNGYENGFMSDLEWHMYSHWFTFLTSSTCRAPQGFIYLRISPSRALERIQNRARKAESGITLDYLDQLHACHERFLVQKDGLSEDLKNVPVLVLDADLDFEHDRSRFVVLMKSLESFLDTQSRQNKVIREQHARAF